MNYSMLAQAIIAYLVGSLSGGMIISRIMGKGDIREHGSGGTGATNVQRNLGTMAGILVFLFDFLKGIGVLWAISHLPLSYLHLAGLMVILGHIFPIYHKFRGGKGIATAFGVFVYLNWQIALIAFGVFLVVVLATRYISLGSIIAAISVSVFFFTMANEENRGIFALIVAIIVILKHKANIFRLVRGQESKISFKSKKG